MQRHAHLHLASTSPRRRRLLEDAGIAFQLVAPGPEPAGSGRPAERALERAASKARGAAATPDDDLVLGVDTVVELDGRELGKPADHAAAERALRALSGREHLVHTALCLCTGDRRREWRALATARVACDALDDPTLAAYLDSQEWRGKAGAYGIQGAASRFMRVSDGDLDTVIGLPIRSLAGMLARAEGERCDRS